MTESETTALVAVDQPLVMTRTNVHRLLKHLEAMIAEAIQPHLFETNVAPDYLAITRSVQGR